MRVHAGVPYVVTFHGGGHPSKLRNAIRGVQNQAYAPLLRRANKLIATAKFEVSSFGKVLGVSASKFAYIPNGCDIAASTVTPQPLNPDAPLILSVGRLERYKGHQHAIAALPHVLKEMPNAKLRIVGGGDYEGELNALIARLNLQASAEVRAVKPTDRQGMAEVLASASLVMLMSEYETHPMAMLEAIALGRSVLVSNTSGLQELADDGYAKAAPLNSTPEQLAQAMLHQLRHPHTPKTIHLPTWDDCSNGLLGLYNEIVRQPVANEQATSLHSSLQCK
ncbi:MAG: glycosyltransferase family 4 protein [Anaerolineae bacterium]|nr:glycosyltransferase family 4 protein [Anaerolineae bacterium]